MPANHWRRSHFLRLVRTILVFSGCYQVVNMACCGANGSSLGYSTPLDAVKSGNREKLLYVVAVVPDKSR